MGAATVGEAPEIVEGMSEHMVLATYADAKNIIIFGVDLEGPIDEEAMKLALYRAVESFPHFLSGVRESAVMGRGRLIWMPIPDHHPELHVSSLDLSDPSLSFEDSLLRHLGESLTKDWDLLHTVPTEFHLLQLGKGRYSFVTLVHHAAADAWTMAQFLKRLLGSYHEIVTGDKLRWPGRSLTQHPRAAQKRLNPDKHTWRDLLFICRNALKSYMIRHSFPKGNSNPRDGREHHIKTKLTSDETKHVLEIASRKKTSSLDLLVGGMSRAIDEWNAHLNMRLGTIITGITVEMRTRLALNHSPVNSSAIYLRSRPTDRTDPELFARFLSAQRIRYLRDCLDVKITQAAYSLADAIRILPFNLRRKLVYSLLKRPLCTLLITFLGTGWSEGSNGRRTAEFFLTKPGGLEVTEIHAIGHELSIRSPLRLWAGLFRNQLNLLLTLPGNRFTRAEAQQFMDLAVKALLNNPFERASAD